MAGPGAAWLGMARGEAIFLLAPLAYRIDKNQL
jgi:hypothetical protein